MKNTIFFLSATLMSTLFAFSLIPTSFAQTEAGDLSGKVETFRALDDGFVAPETTFQKVGPREEQKKIVHRDDYLPPNFENLSQLYWRIGMLDIKNDDSIDNFMLINECDIYEKYYYNDFEWRKVREAARSYIANNVKEFPSHFYTVLPIELGRYNQREQYFEVTPDTLIDQMSRIRILGTDDNTVICGKYKGRNIANYPPGILLNTLRPVSLHRVPVVPAVAQKYITEVDEKYAHYDLKKRQQNYKREAHVRLFFSVSSYKGIFREGNSVLASTIAEIEGVEIYADPEMTKLLYKKNVEYTEQSPRAQ